MLLGRERVVSVDFNADMVEQLRKVVQGNTEWTGLVADLTDERFVDQLRPFRCDSLTALNVIEHIEDDARALGTLRRVLPEGGKAVVLVPAHAWLYGTFDRAVGHYRRYTKAELARKMTEAGFAVDRIFYFNMIGVLGWYANYRLLKVRSTNQGTTLQIGLFDKFIVPIARQIETLVSPPFGISAICLATAR